jgi:hypothetical protein
MYQPSDCSAPLPLALARCRPQAELIHHHGRYRKAVRWPAPCFQQGCSEARPRGCPQDDGVASGQQQVRVQLLLACSAQQQPLANPCIAPVLVSFRMFETFSYLPPLSDDQIARQVDYIVNNGWTPCLEFSEPELAYVSNENCVRMGAVTCVSGTLAQEGSACASAYYVGVF